MSNDIKIGDCYQSDFIGDFIVILNIDNNTIFTYENSTNSIESYEKEDFMHYFEDKIS